MSVDPHASDAPGHADAVAHHSTDDHGDDHGHDDHGHGEDPLGGGGRYAVESYLDHHAEKLVHRFDANSYVVLTEARYQELVAEAEEAYVARVKASLEDLKAGRVQKFATADELLQALELDGE